MRFAIVAVSLALAGCASVPLAPDPTVDLGRRWTIVGVNGVPTGGGPRFNLELNPRYGSAQFGCNAGSGPYLVRDGWFVAGDPWIITAASCPDKEEWLRFEHDGFQILARPLAVMRRSGGGIRLRNELGSIDLTRAP